MANVDMELDFYGATLISIARNGDQEEYPLVLGDWITIEHSIDFTTPGEYEVAMVIHHNPYRQFAITFTVQVING